MSTPGLTPEQRQALLEGPASPPPPGRVSNLDDPPNSYLQWRALFVTLWTVASACVFIRIYAKAFVVRRFRMSDCTCLFFATKEMLTVQILWSLLGLVVEILRAALLI